MTNKPSTKKHKKSNKSNSLKLLLLVFVFAIILVSTVFTDWLEIMDNKKETEELGKYYVNLQEQGASLNSEVIKLQDPEYVARYAREKYMFTKDGEIILRLVDGSEIKTNSNKEEQKATEEENNSQPIS